MNDASPIAPTDEATTNELFAEALRLAQAEFCEMPGLRLSVAQASRLFAFDSALCSAVLWTLVRQRFLVHTRNAMFQRP